MVVVVVICVILAFAVFASESLQTKARFLEFVNLAGNIMTDPISAMLIMLKNASNAGRPSIVVPFSKVKFAIAQVLEKEGYLSAITKRTRGGHPALELSLAKKIAGVNRISKPSRRLYMGVKEIRPVRQGHGILVLTTPKGILTGNEARKAMVGGEPLFTLW